MLKPPRSATGALVTLAVRIMFCEGEIQTMNAYHLTFALEDGDAELGDSDVRVWLDHLPDHGLGSEHELPLARSGNNEWSATFLLAGLSQSSFLYRIGVAAPPGCVWSLEVRRVGRDRGTTVLADSDIVTRRKEWLVGSCSA